jgi:hypothetical protein
VPKIFALILGLPAWYISSTIQIKCVKTLAERKFVYKMHSAHAHELTCSEMKFNLLAKEGRQLIAHLDGLEMSTTEYSHLVQ